MAGVDDILRATLVMDNQDAQIANMVFNFRVISGSEANYTTIVTAIGNWVSSAAVGVLDSISSSIASVSIDLAERNVGTHQWDGKTSLVYTGFTGTGVDPAYANGVAAVVRFITETARRQARKFVPGMMEAQITGNSLSAAVIADMVLLGVDLNDDVTAGGATLRPCVYNDNSGSVFYETASDFIQTVIVNTFIGYQRRRQPGDGI